MEIIAATQNKNKIREINSIMSKLGFNVVPRDEAGVPDFEVEENGTTFEDNSYIKAKAIMDFSGKPTIADDSGLEVHVLNGEPGVYSARYAGIEGPDADSANNTKLLKKLEAYSEEERKAQFVAVITLLFPDGKTVVAKGTCPGRIATELMGDNGFGYDPLFIPDGYKESFAQMDADEKNTISHRAKALHKLYLDLNKDE